MDDRKKLLAAWAHNASNNPIDDDQALFASCVTELLREVERLRTALAFYADEKNWKWDGAIGPDMGARAREALGEGGEVSRC